MDTVDKADASLEKFIRMMGRQVRRLRQAFDAGLSPTFGWISDDENGYVVITDGYLLIDGTYKVQISELLISNTADKLTDGAVACVCMGNMVRVKAEDIANFVQHINTKSLHSLQLVDSKEFKHELAIGARCTNEQLTMPPDDLFEALRVRGSGMSLTYLRFEAEVDLRQLQTTLQECSDRFADTIRLPGKG